MNTQEKKTRRYPKEVKERAVRLVFEHQDEHSSQWATITSVASKLGMTPETLRHWIKQAEIDEGRKEGLTTADKARIKELERENRELCRANEILKASCNLSSDRQPKA